MSLESIPIEKLKDGINKVYANAESFLNDVYILEEYDQWVHGYTLCQLAIEELAKIPMLFQLWIDRINDTSIDYKKLDSDFKNHSIKTKISTEFEIFFFNMYKEQTGAKWVDEAIKKREDFLNNLKQLNDLKNESFYVSVKNNDFQAPTDIITKEMFDTIHSTALLRKLMFENLIKATEKHIELIAKSLKESVS